MLLSKKELDYRLEGLQEMGVSSLHQQYLIDSVNDAEYEDIIKLIDELSSAAFHLTQVATPYDTRMAHERHLEARNRLIGRIKLMGAIC